MMVNELSANRKRRRTRFPRSGHPGRDRKRYGSRDRCCKRPAPRVSGTDRFIGY
jgi:hypothetical protein